MKPNANLETGAGIRVQEAFEVRLLPSSRAQAAPSALDERETFSVVV